MLRYLIRSAREADGVEINRLAGQLGYPAPDDAMRPRLQRLLASPNDIVFVAESAEGGLLGWIHGFLSQLVEYDYRVEIGGFVIDEKFQRKGLGRALIGQLEKWAVERGVSEVVVRCRSTRAGAHLFYESLGYSRAKMQVVFRKSLS